MFLCLLAGFFFLPLFQLTIINNKNNVGNILENETSLTLELGFTFSPSYNSIFLIRNQFPINMRNIINNVTKCKNLTNLKLDLKYFKNL